MFWFFGREACGILVLRPGIEPAPCIGRWSPNHWTAREVPETTILKANPLRVEPKRTMFVISPSLIQLELDVQTFSSSAALETMIDTQQLYVVNGY